MTPPTPETSLLTHGIEAALPEGALASQLAEGRPLRVKLGIDPTAPDIHLGHVVVLEKLAQFQRAGHQVVLIIGDYTARVGDPSGRDTQRPVLSGEEIDANAKTFTDQAFKVLDRDGTEVRFNSEWLDMPVADLFQLVGRVTVAQLLAREDFRTRMEQNRPLSVLELLYPIMQGYDSVAIRADVELGGTDQTFNLLLGRDLQQAHGQPGQSVVTLPILPGLDGERRMSKSLGNYVGVTDPPDEMFGKVMSIPDEVMGTYYDLLLGDRVPDGPAVEAKRALARRLVDRFHAGGAATEAEAHFDRVHKQREAPEDMPEVAIEGGGDVHLPALLAGAFDISSSEARRLLTQGGVKLDGEPISGDRLDVPASELEGRVIQVGKRRFARLRT
ncbi:MAG: tyrosine--tRNA ligase [Solirubrobacterales bacterium]|nr:tyrosine--tRNA ligase [Solirubrobacterales bacterium]